MLADDLDCRGGEPGRGMHSEAVMDVDENFKQERAGGRGWGRERYVQTRPDEAPVATTVLAMVAFDLSWYQSFSYRKVAARFGGW